LSKKDDKKVLIYVDGLQWHSSVRQRTLDNRITNRLQMMDYLVLRFLGSEVQHAPEMCVGQIKRGLDFPSS
jgi:very-short-patch-repair endonuclease